jgi:hypothetical protein
MCPVYTIPNPLYIPPWGAAHVGVKDLAVDIERMLAMATALHND